MSQPARWRKAGLVVRPDPAVPWMVSHVMLPVPWVRKGALRLYLTGRNLAGCGQVGWCSLDMSGEQPIVVAVSPSPSVAIGPLGAFDDHGVSASALVEHQGRTFLYYTGWTLGVTVPFYVFPGLAVSDDGGETFRKASRAPMLERTDDDPFLMGHPSVLVDEGVWRMWYVSCSEWRVVNGEPRHYYRIKYAESADGIQWRRWGHVCIDYASDEEYAIARPWVIKSDGVYRMWYSHRGDAYRIGYAESRDGLAWDRLDDRAGIDVSPDGWDSEMIEYPCTVTAGGGTWMFYNGNGFGRTGIGCARLES